LAGTETGTEKEVAGSGKTAIVRNTVPVKSMPFRVTQKEQTILLVLAALLVLGLVGLALL
jgi:hypothetical protein